MLVSSFFALWMECYIEPAGLRPSTVAMYKRAAAAICAEMGSEELSSLDPLRIRKWLLSVAATQPRAAQLDHLTWMRAAKIGAKLGYMAAALADPDLLPKISHKAKRAKVLTDQQLLAYVHACADHGAAGAVLALCCCGLRRGEALGAMWRDLDGEVLHIQRQRQPGRGAHAEPLKTESSERYITLPPVVMDILHARGRSRLLGYISGQISEAELYRAHAACLAAAGASGITLHGLRHTYAYLAARDGVPMRVLQAALGHASMRLTAELYTDHFDHDSVTSFPAVLLRA